MADPAVLFIPHKTRLAQIILDAQGTPTPLSMSTASSQDFDNLKAIESWAREWLALTSPASKCQLHIPHKSIADLSPDLSFDNYKAIERWAEQISRCSCTSSLGSASQIPVTDMRFWFKADSLTTLADGDAVGTWLDSSGNGLDAIQTVADRKPTFHLLGSTGRLADKCRLFIPHKAVLSDLQRGVITFQQAQTQEFDNYKAIERWAHLYTSGECSCTKLAVVRFDGNHELPVEGVFPITGGQWTSFAVASRVGTTGVMQIASSDTLSEHRGPKWAGFTDEVAVATAFNTAFEGFSEFQSGATAGTFHVISAVRDGSTIEVFLDGSSGGTTATTGTPEPGISTTPLFLGSDSGRSFGTQRLIGDIAEVIGFPYALTSSERGQVEAYLTEKWATIL